MRSVKEQYWRYSLFVIILVLGVVIFAELTPYIGGLLGAMTIYVREGVLAGRFAAGGGAVWRRRCCWSKPSSAS